MKKLSLVSDEIKRPRNVLLIPIFFLSLATVTGAMAAQQPKDWQTQRLLHPTPNQLESERQGHIFIYDGLSAKLIDRALNQAFDRIDSMMFINIKPADNKDVPTTGAGTDETEDDDSDDGC